LLGTGLWLWHRFSSDASNSQQKVVGGPSLFDKDGKARKDIPGFAGIQGGMQDDRPHRLKMPKYGFTFTTPNNRWRILTSPVAQPPKNLALSMCAGDEMYGLPRAISGTYSLPELTLLVNDHDGSPIETISQQAKMEIAAELQDWRLLDEKLMTINSKKAYRLASSAVLPAGGQSEEVHLLQFYYIGPKSKVFILTFSASPHSFADYRERFEMSGESVEIE